jgi:putative ABC transport system permease protein
MSRPVRSALALLGLTVAIAGMVGLFSVASGLEDTFDKSFGRIPGLAAMQPGAFIPIFSRLPSDWVPEIAAIPGVRTARQEIWARAQLINGKPTFNPPRLLFGTDIKGTLSMNRAVYRDDMKSGRFLTVDDIGTTNCVISHSIAKEFHCNVGDKLRIDGYDLPIVGIYDCQSVLFDVAIVLDGNAVRKIGKIDDSIVSSVYVEPDGTVPNADLTEKITEHFRGRRSDQPAMNPLASGPEAAAIKLLSNAAKLFQPQADPEAESAKGSGESEQKRDEVEDSIEVHTAQDWANKFAERSSELDIFLYLLTGIGIVISLLSILNTMLMSVAERLIEFGVLKANGWSAWDIVQLITWESAILGFSGGVLGCLFGWIATHVMNSIFVSKLHLYASADLLVFSLIFSTIIGMIGGLYPAMWAQRMSPMEAIRRG